MGLINPHFLTFFAVSILFPLYCQGGFQSPSGKEQIYAQFFGQPCDCKGGIIDIEPNAKVQTDSGEKTKILATPQLTTRGPRDCQDKTAYLTADISAGGYSSSVGWKPPSWKCIKKPSIIPTVDGRLRPCDCNSTATTFTVYDQMHSSCYDSAQSCHHNNKTYLTAILKNTRQSSVQISTHNSPRSASCRGTPGQHVCWKVQSPIHVSNGGGPSDRAR